MTPLKIFFILILIIFLTKCEELVSIEAKLFPESSQILYNDEIYVKISQYENLKNSQILESKVLIQEPQQKLLVEKKVVPFSGEFWLNLVVFLLLACFTGTVSGLTIGYLSIDSLILEIKMKNGDENERYYAKKIYNLVSNHHWLLVSLLLCNSFACEAMPIVLDRIVSEIMAIIVSVTVLLFVGEIIPQAVCTGPSQMKIASCLAPFTSFLMYLTYPISYPIAKFMDYFIGVHGKSRFCNSDLKSIIELHVKEIISNYSSNQIGYFTGFLNIMNKKIGELILPIDKVLKIDYNAKINKITLKKIIDSGYSRIPVYENKPNHLIGILRTKQLVGQDLSVPCTINQLGLNLTRPIHAFEDTLFLDLFEKFKSGKSHMAFIHQKELEIEFLHKVSLTSDNYDKIIEKNIPLTPIVGIITLENLIEFWFNIQILDEEDYRAHDMLNRSLTRSRKKLFDAIGIEKVNDKINKLYDDSEKKERNYNDEFSNDYHAF